MKPLRTGLGVGLLTGAAGAAVKLFQDRRAGTLGAGAAAPRVVTGTTATRVRAAASKALVPAGAEGSKGLKDAVADGKESLRARRAARRATANRPAWVVAPTPGVATGVVRGAAPTRPTPTAPRKVPNLVPKNPVSAKTVGASMGKYAVKRVGKVVGKVAADRMGKVIEVIEVLEQVVASVSEPATKPEITITGPGASINPPPATVALAPNPARPGGPPASSGGAAAGDAPARPTGTRVSVRTFERGPRVVVGPGVTRPPADKSAPAAARGEGETPEAAAASASETDVAVDAAVEAVADAVEAAVEASAEAASEESSSVEAASVVAASVVAGAEPSHERSNDGPPAATDGPTDAAPAPAPAKAGTRTARKARSTTAKAAPKTPRVSPKAPAAKKASTKGEAATRVPKPRAAKRPASRKPSGSNGDAPATTGKETG
jgi:hypothetical protein